MAGTNWATTDAYMKRRRTPRHQGLGVLLLLLVIACEYDVCAQKVARDPTAMAGDPTAVNPKLGDPSSIGAYPTCRKPISYTKPGTYYGFATCWDGSTTYGRFLGANRPAVSVFEGQDAITAAMAAPSTWTSLRATYAVSGFAATQPGGITGTIVKLLKGYGISFLGFTSATLADAQAGEVVGRAQLRILDNAAAGTTMMYCRKTDIPHYVENSTWACITSVICGAEEVMPGYTINVVDVKDVHPVSGDSIFTTSFGTACQRVTCPDESGDPGQCNLQLESTFLDRRIWNGLLFWNATLFQLTVDNVVKEMMASKGNVVSTTFSTTAPQSGCGVYGKPPACKGSDSNYPVTLADCNPFKQWSCKGLCNLHGNCLRHDLKHICSTPRVPAQCKVIVEGRSVGIKDEAAAMGNSLKQAAATTRQGDQLGLVDKCVCNWYDLTDSLWENHATYSESTTQLYSYRYIPRKATAQSLLYADGQSGFSVGSYLRYEIDCSDAFPPEKQPAAGNCPLWLSPIQKAVDLAFMLPALSASQFGWKVINSVVSLTCDIIKAEGGVKALALDAPVVNTVVNGIPTGCLA